MATSKRRPTALVSVFGSIHTDVMTDETGVPALPGFEDRFDPALLQALGDIAVQAARLERGQAGILALLRGSDVLTYGSVKGPGP